MAAGALVADNSSAWRMDPDTPLVVPEVNPQALPPDPRAGGGAELLHNPGIRRGARAASSPLGLERVIVSTYQSTSGAGARAMAELESTTRGYLAGTEAPPEKLRIRSRST